MPLPSTPSVRNSARRLQLWLLLFGAAVIGMLWGSVAYQLAVDRQQALDQARQHSLSLARAVEEHIVGSIKEVDRVLLYLKARFERDPDAFEFSSWRGGAILLKGVSLRISLIGADGFLESDTFGTKPGTVDLRDREHFAAHVHQDSSALFISKPVLGRISKIWTIQLTRRVNNPDGSFAGVLVVGFDPRNLSEFFKTIDIGPNGVIALVGTDGIIRARSSDSENSIGRDIGTSRLFVEAAKRPIGSFITTSELDGVQRVYGFRWLDSYPLIVSVGASQDTVLEQYTYNRTFYILAAAIITVILLVALRLLLREVNERQQTEEALREAKDAADSANRAKSEFLATMSHEIRTPMNGVLGMTDILLDSDLTADQRRIAETVRKSGETLLGIINDILDLSKLEAGKVDIESAEFDLHQAIDDVLAVLAPRAAAEVIALGAIIRPDVPRLVVGDQGRLRQILMNLLGNGVKFTQRGGVHVDVKSIASMRDNQAGESIVLRFDVTDTGIGISEDSQRRLFEKFSQADASMSRRYGGTGLGLAISKRLVEAMGGMIGLTSQRGAGSTFWFTVAFARGSVEGGQIPPALAGRRVLLIDAHAVHRTLMGRILEQAGVVVTEVDTLDGAFAALARTKSGDHGFDAGVLNRDLALELEAERFLALGRAIPLVVLGKRAADAFPGLRAVVPKPVTQKMLYAVIRGVIDGVPQADVAEAASTRNARASRSSSEKTAATLRVLLAEDNPVNQMVARTILEKAGFAVDIAEDGNVAVRLAERTAYDVILMDVQMPDLDGLEATRRIRASGGPCAAVPIIAITANAMSSDREICLAAGMTDYLSKPFKKDQMLALIAQVTACEAPRAVRADVAVPAK